MLVLGLILVLPLLAFPQLLLSLVVFLAPIYWLPFIPIETYESTRDILSLGLFCSVTFSIAVKRISLRLPRQDSPIPILILFLAALLGGVVFSATSASSLTQWFKAVQAVVFLAMLYVLVRSERDVKRLLILFLIGQLISVSYFWFEFSLSRAGVVPPWSIPYAHLFRGDGGLSYRRTAFSNSCAHVLPIVLALAFSLRDKGRQVTAILFGTAACMIFAAIVVAHGRAGLVAALVCGFVLLWMNSKKLTIAFVTLAFLVVLVSPGLILDRFVNAGPNATSWLAQSDGWQWFDRWTGYRFGAYLNAIDIAVTHPFGVGLGNYQQSVVNDYGYRRSVSGSLLDVRDVSSAHNLYLNVASEAGMLAFVSLATFTLWYLNKVRELAKTSKRKVVVQMITGVIMAQFITSLFEVEIFWTLMRALPFWISLVGLTLLRANHGLGIRQAPSTPAPEEFRRFP
jgi:O-antigen ligase